jgi:hypothetical protein
MGLTVLTVPDLSTITTTITTITTATTTVTATTSGLRWAIPAMAGSAASVLTAAKEQAA